MKGLIWTISEYGQAIPAVMCESCFESAILSQKYRYCVVLMLIYNYLSHVH